MTSSKGLYQYTRLPFGVASAPAIFMCTMDTILQACTGAACYIPHWKGASEMSSEAWSESETAQMQVPESQLGLLEALC